jgi:FOG: EAL domain
MFQNRSRADNAAVVGADLTGRLAHLNQAAENTLARSQAGRESSRPYTAQTNARAIEKLDTESALRKALAHDEFVLHYQPKIRLDTGELSGVEALIRWNRPGQGLIQPLDFIPMLEETGLIAPVGEWVIHTVCRQIAAWQRAGVGAICTAMNLSSRQFISETAERNLLGFEIETARAVRNHDVDPTLLEFELTESTLMSHAENSVAILHRLKALGIRISTDDFGTGFSNLAYLKRFPIDTIKIDRIFISDVDIDASDAAITVAIIAMAHSLKLRVVAEGVETREQLEFLRAQHCDEIQGFYFSKPLPATEMSQLLRNGRTLQAAAN